MDPQRVLLTIAGFDPSSGAGITADLQVFAAHGFFGISAITALTVQSTTGVRATQPVDPDWLTQTLACLQEDLPPAGVKIGMLGTAGNVHAIADFLTGLPFEVPVVLDPVMLSSSGKELLSGAGMGALREQLLPLVTCITPNRAELGRLTGSPVTGREDMERAGLQLAARVPGLRVVVTGGDLDSADDCVIEPAGGVQWLSYPRIVSRATHGTGCAFSSALLCRLCDDATMPFHEQVRLAKQFVRSAILSAAPLGRGYGPMNLRP